MHDASKPGREQIGFMFAVGVVGYIRTRWVLRAMRLQLQDG
jgi:hypothetical protein